MSSLDDVKGFLVEWVKEAVEEVITDMEAAGKNAQDAMVAHIEVEGTQNEWKSDWTWKQELQGRLPADRTESIPGRDHTGVFKNAIEVTTERNPDGAEIRIGWPEQATEREQYFSKQEHGFRYSDPDSGVVSGDRIEGVHSLQVAMMVAEEQLKKGGARWRMV